MTGLRARQKEDRSRKILEAARALFEKYGIEGTKIEDIANHAGVSGVTVHNYYRTKAGILINLVIENDSLLLEKLEKCCTQNNLFDLSVMFSRTIAEHAVSNLRKVVWRQVIAAVTTDNAGDIASAYFDQDQMLAGFLIEKIRLLQRDDRVSASVNVEHLGKAIFHLQNARFIQFVCSEDLTPDDVAQRIRNDLSAMFAVNPPESAAVNIHPQN
ncbi:TetR/AcrR family transcriptional regulator [uncultured Ruegeria sp.]|uniref:TetR/AcrR family transcriptional regulator n=1 Tax=uncultured Ruegeria sp. TaxID=259304 RepID=UPI0026051482|nr:TetR/AcrR family transcriptional regulator [uncultured Ruegeria sp.]